MSRLSEKEEQVRIGSFGCRPRGKRALGRWAKADRTRGLYLSFTGLFEHGGKEKKIRSGFPPAGFDGFIGRFKSTVGE